MKQAPACLAIRMPLRPVSKRLPTTRRGPIPTTRKSAKSWGTHSRCDALQLYPQLSVPNMGYLRAVFLMWAAVPDFLA